MIRTSSMRQWMFFWNIAFTALFGFFLFVMLDLVSFGVLTSLVTMAVLFVLFGVAHYAVWGQMLSNEVGPEPKAPAANQRVSTNLVVEINDQERAELLKLLEQTRNAADPRARAVRSELLDKIRMFGA